MDLDEEIGVKYDFPITRIELWNSLFPFDKPESPNLPKRNTNWLLMAGFGVVFVLFAYVLANTIKAIKKPTHHTAERRRRNDSNIS